MKVKRMTPAETIVLITKLAAKCHKKVMKSGGCERAFHATATWMPVDHLMRDSEGDTKDQDRAHVEMEVDLQHFPEYKYTEQCTQEIILKKIDEREEIKNIGHEEREKRQAKEAVARKAEEESMSPFVEKAETASRSLEEIVIKDIKDEVENIKAVTGFSRFVIGGSYPVVGITQSGLLKLKF